MIIKICKAICCIPIEMLIEENENDSEFYCSIGDMATYTLNPCYPTMEKIIEIKGKRGTI